MLQDIIAETQLDEKLIIIPEIYEYFKRIDNAGMHSCAFTICIPCLAVSELPGQQPKISVIVEDTFYIFSLQKKKTEELTLLF